MAKMMSKEKNEEDKNRWRRYILKVLTPLGAEDAFGWQSVCLAYMMP